MGGSGGLWLGAEYILAAPETKPRLHYISFLALGSLPSELVGPFFETFCLEMFEDVFGFGGLGFRRLVVPLKNTFEKKCQNPNYVLITF